MNDLISREARIPISWSNNDFIAPESDSGMVQTTVIGADTLERASALLSGIEGGLEKALRGAMTRSTSYLRSNTAKAIRERYAISVANIRASRNVTVSYDYKDGIQACVYFSGERIPLYRFDGAAPKMPTPDTSKRYGVEFEENRWRYLYPSIPAAGHVLKDTSPRTFSKAFVARMKNGHIGIFERTGGMTSQGKDEIEELFGPSVPQMLGNEEVETSLAEQTMQKFEELLDHEILRILNGWGK